MEQKKLEEKIAEIKDDYYNLDAYNARGFIYNLKAKDCSLCVHRYKNECRLNPEPIILPHNGDYSCSNRKVGEETINKLLKTANDLLTFVEKVRGEIL